MSTKLVLWIVPKIVSELVSGSTFRKPGRTKATGGKMKLLALDAFVAVGMGKPVSMWPASRRRNRGSPSATTVRSYHPLLSVMAKKTGVLVAPEATVFVHGVALP